MMTYNKYNTKFFKYYISSFAYGFIVDMIDNLNDNSCSSFTDKNLKYFLHIFAILVLLYYIYIHKKYSDLISLFFIFGGLIGFFFSKNTINKSIWLILIFINIPNFILNFDNYIYFIYNCDEKIMSNIIFFLFPLSIFTISYCLIENKLIPQEYSSNKLIERIIIFFIYVLVIKYKFYLKKFFRITNFIFKNLIIIIYFNLGYYASSIIDQLINFLYLL